MRTRQPRPRPLSRRRRFPPIPLADDVPESIRDLVRKRVEPILGDVRVMLAQPDRSGGPAFTLSATIVLASVVGGLARVFDTEPEDGKNFKNIAREYPLDEEPPDAVTDRARQPKRSSRPRAPRAPIRACRSRCRHSRRVGTARTSRRRQRRTGRRAAKRRSGRLR